MYRREISEMPERLVVKGKPVFGTFPGHPARLDIRGIFRPYGVAPLPVFITNLRIKSKLDYTFVSGDYIIYVSFFDAKIFGYSEVTLWNRKTGQKYIYRSLMGIRRRFIPHDMEAASTSNFSKKRYTRISWDRSHGNFSVFIDLKGDGVRPSVRMTISGDFNSPEFSDVTVVAPAPTRRRASACYKAFLPAKGTLTLESKGAASDAIHLENGLSFFAVTRTYMKFRSHGDFVIGLGEVKGKKLAFRICMESQAPLNSDRINKNVLFYDGKMTALPPVRITHSFGTREGWVIQDTENMIDLTFTPRTSTRNTISAFVLRAVYEMHFGTFEGTLMTSGGEKIGFKSVSGIAENYLIRL